jgi:hypothetical protein
MNYTSEHLNTYLSREKFVELCACRVTVSEPGESALTTWRSLRMMQRVLDEGR